MNNVICFSSDIKTAFKDYIYHYLTEQSGRKEFDSYDKTISFAEKDAKMNKMLIGKVKSLSGLNFSENTEISQEMWAANPNVRWATMAVTNSLIDMIIPEVIDKTIGLYTESKIISMGDSASFTVEPNDLFVVSKAGRNQRTVEFQRQFAGTVTVVPENRAITVFVNLYRVLCGMDSLAKFVTKAIMSIESQITREVYTAFDTAMNALPTGAGTAGLKVAGYDAKAVVSLAQKVQAYNNGAPVAFVGTKLALHDIMPDNANYRYMLDSEYVRMFYVRNAFGYDMIELPQIAKTDGSYDLALKDDRFYIVSPASQKIVKLVYEGSTMSNTVNAYDSADLTEATTLNKSWGIAIATNATVGIVTLS